MDLHIREMSYLLFGFLLLFVPANSLDCYSCIGEKTCERKETCTEDNASCLTSILEISSFTLSSTRILKGCQNAERLPRKSLFSPSNIVKLSLQETVCKSNLCNSPSNTSSLGKPNDLNCFNCISPGKDCDSESMRQAQCRGDHNQCIDMKIAGTIGSLSDTSMKGCGSFPECTGDQHFSNQKTSLMVSCCKENFCNSKSEWPEEDKSPNGKQCYSCQTVDGKGCSSEDSQISQCYGPLTSCVEMAGVSMQDEKPKVMVIKGCATPTICTSSAFPLMHNLNNATVQCCEGDLCNNKFTEDNYVIDGSYTNTNMADKTSANNTSQCQKNSIVYGMNTNNTQIAGGSGNGSVAGNESTASNTTLTRQNITNFQSIPLTTSVPSVSSNSSGLQDQVKNGSVENTNNALPDYNNGSTTGNQSAEYNNNISATTSPSTSLNNTTDNDDDFNYWDLIEEVIIFDNGNGTVNGSINATDSGNSTVLNDTTSNNNSIYQTTPPFINFEVVVIDNPSNLTTEYNVTSTLNATSQPDTNSTENFDDFEASGFSDEDYIFMVDSPTVNDTANSDISNQTEIANMEQDSSPSNASSSNYDTVNGIVFNNAIKGNMSQIIPGSMNLADVLSGLNLSEFYDKFKSPNGKQCYSCGTANRKECSSKESWISPCYGPFTSCVEMTGISLQDDKPRIIVIKGCATPDMCQSITHPMLQNIYVLRCCEEDVCYKFTTNNFLTGAQFTSNDSGVATTSPSVSQNSGNSNVYGMNPIHSQILTTPVSSSTNSNDTNQAGGVNSSGFPVLMASGSGNSSGPGNGSFPDNVGQTSQNNTNTQNISLVTSVSSNDSVHQDQVNNGSTQDGNNTGSSSLNWSTEFTDNTTPIDMTTPGNDIYYDDEVFLFGNITSVTDSNNTTDSDYSTGLNMVPSNGSQSNNTRTVDNATLSNAASSSSQMVCTTNCTQNASGIMNQTQSFPSGSTNSGAGGSNSGNVTNVVVPNINSLPFNQDNMAGSNQSMSTLTNVLNGTSVQGYGSNYTGNLSNSNLFNILMPTNNNSSSNNPNQTLLSNVGSGSMEAESYNSGNASPTSPTSVVGSSNSSNVLMASNTSGVGSSNGDHVSPTSTTLGVGGSNNGNVSPTSTTSGDESINSGNILMASNTSGVGSSNGDNASPTSTTLGVGGSNSGNVFQTSTTSGDGSINSGNILMASNTSGVGSSNGDHVSPTSTTLGVGSSNSDNVSPTFTTSGDGSINSGNILMASNTSGVGSSNGNNVSPTSTTLGVGSSNNDNVSPTSTTSRDGNINSGSILMASNTSGVGSSNGDNVLPTSTTLGVVSSNSGNVSPISTSSGNENINSGNVLMASNTSGVGSSNSYNISTTTTTSGDESINIGNVSPNFSTAGDAGSNSKNMTNVVIPNIYGSLPSDKGTNVSFTGNNTNTGSRNESLSGIINGVSSGSNPSENGSGNASTILSSISNHTNMNGNGSVLSSSSAGNEQTIAVNNGSSNVGNGNSSLSNSPQQNPSGGYDNGNIDGSSDIYNTTDVIKQDQNVENKGHLFPASLSALLMAVLLNILN